MKRLGKYTGKIYDEDYDFSNCPECCLCLTKEQEKDEQYISNMRVKNTIDCATCFGGCPASK